MIKYQKSIQNKVQFGYYICLALIVAVALLNYINLRTINKKVAISMVISEFFDTTLEMRRFEKNYILYRDKDDYTENLRFTEKAEDIIEKNKEALKGLTINAEIAALVPNIQQYKSLMKEYFQLDRTLNPAKAYTLEGKMRLHGKKIVTATEAISIKERQYIQSLINSSQGILIVSIVFLIIAGCLIGQYLSRMVVSPLKQLEENMKKIAEGKFNSLSIESADSEIVSLVSAFSKMMKELELRQMRFIVQSEKLACLGTMVSGVVHELNNPLSNISSSCQILHEEIEEPDINFKKELLQQIEEEIDRAKNMVRSLLDFSRKKEFQSQPLPLKFLVEDTIRLIQGDIPAGVEIKVNIPEDTWVIADKQRLQQAFLNIIKNGIEAIPDEGSISVSAEEDLENKLLKINIQDTGLGIEPENIKTIFEPFFTTKGHDKGSGLGLFVAREIIEAHEGAIDVESKVGEGTTFSIKLPIKELADGLQGQNPDCR